jgi:endonuclease G
MIRIFCSAGDMQFDIDGYNDTFYTPISLKIMSLMWGCGIDQNKSPLLAVRYDGVYIVTGGVLRTSSKTIGRERVVVPDFFYKIVLKNDNGNYKMIVFSSQ